MIPANQPVDPARPNTPSFFEQDLVADLANELNDALACDKDVVFLHATTESADNAANSVYQGCVGNGQIAYQFAAVWKAYANDAPPAEIGHLFTAYARAAKLHFASELADYVNDAGRILFRERADSRSDDEAIPHEPW